MTVNEKKSKVMIFSKKRFKQNPTFTFNRKEIQTVQEFTYLGVKMSNTGNFSGHLTQTREKALHAFYKVTRTVDFKKLKPKQANKLFDSLISPILTYASMSGGFIKNKALKNGKKVLPRKCIYDFASITWELTAKRPISLVGLN